MKTEDYIHGYSDYEQQRLWEQGAATQFFMLDNFDFSTVTHYLEPGIGVGAQTRFILQRFPHVRVTGVDLSNDQLRMAKRNLSTLSYADGRYDLVQGKIDNLPFPDHQQFDGAFFCWILEHLPDPIKALEEVKRVLKPGSPVFINETFNNSFYIYPKSPNLMRFWRNQILFEETSNAHPNIGAHFGVILTDLGFTDVEMKPVILHLDKRQPERRKAWLHYWYGVLKSSLDTMLKTGHSDEQLWKETERELDELINNPETVTFIVCPSGWRRPRTIET